MARLELRGVAKAYPGGIVAAVGVDLEVEDGELFVVVGPSGSGKSTLLRLVAGLETLDEGTIHLDGRRIDTLAPAARDVAMVFQDQVLYPHLDVFENIAFGLRARRVGRGEVAERVRASASVLGLDGCLDRAPDTLSGGQRRRVVLGRALVLRPRLFLLDEPFSGLDAPLRASTRAELAELNRNLGATMVLVTHDQGEAMALGERIAVVNGGRVIQVGRPLDLYDRPAGRFVARFLGQPPMNLLPCLVDGSGLEATIRVVGLGEQDPWPLEPGDGMAALRGGMGLGRVDLGLRPEQITLGPDPNTGKSSPRPTASATIRRLEPLGHETLGYLELGPHELAIRLPARARFAVGERVAVAFDLERASWFDAATGGRIA